jgi:hypothetical protein
MPHTQQQQLVLINACHKHDSHESSFKHERHKLRARNDAMNEPIASDVIILTKAARQDCRHSTGRRCKYSCRTTTTCQYHDKDTMFKQVEGDLQAWHELLHVGPANCTVSNTPGAQNT